MLIDRRRFLKGVGGATMLLPALEIFSPRRLTAAAIANAQTTNSFVIIVRHGNGVQQQNDGRNEPERFWPSKLGILDAAAFLDPAGTTKTGEDGQRAVIELQAYAQRLLFLRGLKYGRPEGETNYNCGQGCAHSTSGNICLTASAPSGLRLSDPIDGCNLDANGLTPTSHKDPVYTSGPTGAASLATGESLDYRIARELHPGVEPINLMAGYHGSYVGDILNYRGPQALVSAENSPYRAYKKLFGLPEASLEDTNVLTSRIHSVNDLLRGEIKSFASRTDLSAADRTRLDLHFSSIRDFERKLVCQLPSVAAAATTDRTSDVFENNDNIIEIAKLHMDILALAMSCGVARVGTLQFGNGLDDTKYSIDGKKEYSFHQISHRNTQNDSKGTDLKGADLTHHKIDRLFLQTFKHLLDTLSGYPSVSSTSSTLLDQGLAVWCNDLRDGDHGMYDLPWILAGNCGGYFKNGLTIDTQAATHNKLLNTIGASLGCKNAKGGPLDDFGSAELPGGQLDAIKA